jgi:myo-inositol-1(or 4)-monophosphatase
VLADQAPSLLRGRLEPAVQEREHARPGIASGLGAVGIGPRVIQEGVARVGVDDDLGRHFNGRKLLSQALDVGHRDVLIFGSEETQQRAEQISRRSEWLPGFLLRIEPCVGVQQTVLVREQSIERNRGREFGCRTRREQRHHSAHAKADHAHRSPRRSRVTREKRRRFAHVGDGLGVRERTHEGTRRVDSQIPHVAVEIDREHRKTLRGESMSEIARVLAHAPDVVDQNDTRVNAIARVNENAEIDFAGFHGRRVYSPAMAYEDELRASLDAAYEAGEILRRHYEEGTRTWEKSEGNPVTLADLEADAAIGARLTAAFPDDAILSEETHDDAARLENSRVWIVDPMDGTREFTRHIPEFAVSIALALDGEPVVGVVHNPIAEVSVWATRGGGTFRDGRPVRVSPCTRLRDSIAVVSRSESERNELARYNGWFAGVRAMGSIAWKLACIASGDGDINFSVAPKNEWDVCAGDLLIREAGGVYANYEGGTRRYNQAETWIAPGAGAGNPELFARFVERERGAAVDSGDVSAH